MSDERRTEVQDSPEERPHRPGDGIGPNNPALEAEPGGGPPQDGPPRNGGGPPQGGPPQGGPPRDGAAAPARGARTWGAVVAFIVLLGLVAWGTQQQRQLRFAQLRAENNYRRAFHQLIVHTEAIAENLDRLAVSAGRPQQLYGLEEIRTQASAANASFGALPVGTIPLQQTKSYISHLNNWSREMSVKLQQGGSLTPDEFAQLLALRQDAHALLRGLTDLRDLQAAGQLQWTSMEQFLGAAAAGTASGPLVDGITRLDSTFSTPRNESAESRVSPGSGIGISGEPVTVDAAMREARRYISEKDGETLTYVGEVNGLIQSYRFEATAADGRPIRVDVARNGGQVTWMLADRQVGQVRLTKDQAIAEAERYLAERGYGDMAYSAYEDYGPTNVAMVTLVWRQDDVYVYPDTIRVRIALDNGEVLGVNAMPYLTAHRPREIPPAAISLASMETRIPPHLHLLDLRPAIVEDHLGNEVYAYEAIVQFEGNTYQVFYDSTTGDEVRIARMMEEI